MDDFLATLHEWEVFYSTVSLASVTLAGLLFVSLSIRQERMMEKTYRNVVNLARSSFGDFLYVLMLGLIFLVPHPEPIGLSFALFVLGLSRTIGLGRRIYNEIRIPSERDERSFAARGIALHAVASLGLIIVAIGVLNGVFVSLYALVIVIAALLTNASWNAWLILVAEDEGLA